MLLGCSYCVPGAGLPHVLPVGCPLCVDHHELAHSHLEWAALEQSKTEEDQHMTYR